MEKNNGCHTYAAVNITFWQILIQFYWTSLSNVHTTLFSFYSFSPYVLHGFNISYKSKAAINVEKTGENSSEPNLSVREFMGIH